MKHGRELSFDEDGRPVLITTAAIPYEEEHRQRVRKYVIMMSVRIPAMIGAAVAYGVWHNGLISLAIILISIPLPWAAVLIANDRPPRKAEEFHRYQRHGDTAVAPAADSTALEQRPPPAPQRAPDDPPYDVP
ncbi:DUF3099 domain-containing protein [Mycolicibacterium thermoresistibile]